MINKGKDYKLPKSNNDQIRFFKDKYFEARHNKIKGLKKILV